ncbi:MAG TPA: YciI family protein [Pseudonocardiaceae bacterium]|nr:YciI family protein [Pseudonocardiaceae bacterium]
MPNHLSEDAMQFVLVIYNGDEGSVSDEDMRSAYADYAALNEMENVTGCPPLGLPENATTVRVADGSPVTTGGPYLDVKGAVGGFLIVEAENLEAAVAVAARVPQARMGGAVEVRPSVTYW